MREDHHVPCGWFDVLAHTKFEVALRTSPANAVAPLLKILGEFVALNSEESCEGVPQQC